MVREELSINLNRPNTISILFIISKDSIWRNQEVCTLIVYIDSGEYVNKQDKDLIVFGYWGEKTLSHGVRRRITLGFRIWFTLGLK